MRNMLGYTGRFGGRPVSVMGSGMGMPSISIYATELLTHFGCRRLIRVGSCGAIQPEVGLRALVVALGACTDSSMNRQRFDGFDFAAVAAYPLLDAAVRAAGARSLPAHVGSVISSDHFYPPVVERPPIEQYASARRMGVLAVEMEAAALYGVAAQHRAEALALCMVSDQLVDGTRLSAEDRERTLSDMVLVALDTVGRLDPLPLGPDQTGR